MSLEDSSSSEVGLTAPSILAMFESCSPEELRFSYSQAQKELRGDFELFNELPKELRLPIWQLLLNDIGHRVVEIRPKIKEDKTVKYWQSHTSPPVLLGVCRESRNETLRFYTLAFGMPNVPATIPINFKLDTLFINFKDIPETELQQGIKHIEMSIGLNERVEIKNLAINEKLWEHWPATPAFGEFQLFQNTRIVVLLSGQSKSEFLLGQAPPGRLWLVAQLREAPQKNRYFAKLGDVTHWMGAQKKLNLDDMDAYGARPCNRRIAQRAEKIECVRQYEYFSRGLPAIPR
jgi:2EXR family